MHKKSNITFEDGIYVFNYTDEYGGVVTDGKNIEELRYNIREAMQLHFEGTEILGKDGITNTSRDLSMPVTLSFSNFSYAAQLQQN